MSFIGVIADDLTGAMDAGVQMLHENKQVRVVLGSDALQSSAEDIDFIVINTQSRNVASTSAYEKVCQALDVFTSSGCNIIYKKIDSTLRGNIGAELQAVIDSGLFDCVLVAPALPYNKRTTRNGLHFVSGIELAKTELAKDPFAPINYSAVAQIINQQFKTEVGLLDLATVRAGSPIISQQITEFITNGTKVIVADAVEEQDLRLIAKGAGLFPGSKILCGSAGLFQYLDYTYAEIFGTKNPDPILVVCGSPAAMSKEQIEYVSKNRQDTVVFKVDITSVASNQVADTIHDVTRQVLQQLENGQHVVLDAAGSGKEAISEQVLGDRKQLDANSALVLQLISDIAYAAVTTSQLGALVTLGGDTAVAVTKRLGTRGIDIIGETEPYIPYGKLLGGIGAGMWLITKAGGFGQSDSLDSIIEFLTTRSMSHEQ